MDIMVSIMEHIMEKKNKSVIALFLGAGLVLGISAFLGGMGDKKIPELTCDGSELHYSNEKEVSSLLQGMKARDDKDGDLSDKIFVKNIYEREDGKGIVIYAVKDKSNNIATFQRVFIYDGEAGTMDTRVYKEEEDNVKEEIQSIKDEKKEEFEKLKQEEAARLDEEKKKAELEEEEKIREEQKKIGAPFLKLKSKEVQLKKETQFLLYQYIEELSDNHNEYDVLARRIHIEPEINTEIVGNKVITIYAIDTDGNSSNKVGLKVTVKE